MLYLFLIDMKAVDLVFHLKKLHSDNDASEVGILGHFGTCWDILGQLGRLFDEFGPFELFSQSFPTSFIHYRLI